MKSFISLINQSVRIKLDIVLFKSVVLFTSWELCCLKFPTIKTEPAHPLAFLSFTCLPQAGRQMAFPLPFYNNTTTTSREKSEVHSNIHPEQRVNNFLARQRRGLDDSKKWLRWMWMQCSKNNNTSNCITSYHMLYNTRSKDTSW